VALAEPGLICIQPAVGYGDKLNEMKRRRLPMAHAMVALVTSVFLPLSVMPLAMASTETIKVYTDSGNDDKPIMLAIVKAFQKANPNIHILLKAGPSGTDAVALVKTRLAAGTMDDVFVYYSGSLFQSIDPTKNLVNLADQPWQKNIVSSFYPTVSIGRKIFGAPLGSAMGGGILYNKVVYAKLGLKIPLSWAQFMVNSAKIKKAGIIPIIQTYKDSWTAQLLVLADQFNVQVLNPNFASEFTSNRAQVATTPAALAGFTHLEDIKKAGFINKDYASANLDKGLGYLATGKGAQYPMLTFVATNLVQSYPKLVKNIGFFAEPGASPKSNGLTLWMPPGLFIANTTKHLIAAKKFIAFAMSPAGVAAMSAAVAPTGPYLIKNAKLSKRLSVIASDMLPYINQSGKTAPALEFLSPIKGPNLSQITMEVGSGIKTSKEGAVAYDLDVKKEAIRLGLPAWTKRLN
jgi:raffinose/stachyose/melibiose transport system substrate-binding protein